MKHLVPVIGLSLVLTGCDGDIIKSMARAVLADEINQEQTQAQTGAVELQPVQPIQPSAAEQFGTPEQQVIAQNKTVAQPAATQNARSRFTETPVNAYATVITRHGSNVMVRQSPSKNGRKAGYLSTGEPIRILAETNQCETINGIYNCWVKVQDSMGLTGYSFGGYLDY